jgi:hypothetical protein
LLTRHLGGWTYGNEQDEREKAVGRRKHEFVLAGSFEVLKAKGG